MFKVDEPIKFFRDLKDYLWVVRRKITDEIKNILASHGSVSKEERLKLLEKYLREVLEKVFTNMSD